MSDLTLLERLARRTGCTPQVARARFFSAATSFWRGPLMKLIELVLPGTFRIDWAVIDDAGAGRSLSEVGHAVEIFRYRTRGDRSWFRMRLGFRLSGTRILEFANREFSRPVEPPANGA